MYRYALVLGGLCVLTLSGCASKPPASADLYQRYLQLSAEVAAGSIVERRAAYYSSTFLDEINPDDNKSAYLLTIPGYLKDIDSHYQVIEQRFGCLTLNGYESNGDPVSLQLEYVQNNTEWLVNYMHLDFLEDKATFNTTAVCPRSSQHY